MGGESYQPLAQDITKITEHNLTLDQANCTNDGKGRNEEASLSEQRQGTVECKQKAWPDNDKQAAERLFSFLKR